MSDKLKDRAMVTNVTLPSMGFPYVSKEGEPLLPGGEVFISSMTVRDEKMFSVRGSLIEDRISNVINRCCDLKSVHPDDLIVQDRMFLLLVLRAHSYGTKYPFQIRCSDCDTQFEHSIDLSKDLELKILEEGDWEDTFTVDLPVTGVQLGLRMLTGKDEKQIAKKVARRMQKNMHEVDNPKHSLLLAHSIVTIDGEEAMEANRLIFADNLPVRDRQVISDALEERGPGYDPGIEVTCPNCGYINSVVLPMSADFFRASS